MEESNFNNAELWEGERYTVNVLDLRNKHGHFGERKKQEKQQCSINKTKLRVIPEQSDEDCEDIKINSSTNMSTADGTGKSNINNGIQQITNKSSFGQYNQNVDPYELERRKSIDINTKENNVRKSKSFKNLNDLIVINTKKNDNKEGQREKDAYIENHKTIKVSKKLQDAIYWAEKFEDKREKWQNNYKNRADNKVSKMFKLSKTVKGSGLETDFFFEIQKKGLEKLNRYNGKSGKEVWKTAGDIYNSLFQGYFDITKEQRKRCLKTKEFIIVKAGDQQKANKALFPCILQTKEKKYELNFQEIENQKALNKSEFISSKNLII